MKLSGTRYLQLIIFLSFAVLFTACKSKKEAFVSTNTFQKKSHNEVLKDVQDKELKYKTINGKVSFELGLTNSKDNKKVGGVIKAEKDKAIQVSFRMFGIEGFRMTITPDSIYIIDRMNKQYAVEGISALQKSANFNFYNLQALFTNSIFLPGKEKITKEDYSSYTIDVADDMYLIKAKDKNTQYNFAVNGDDKIVSTLIYRSEGNQAIQWTYKDFIVDQNRVYPTQMIGQVEFNDKRFNIGMAYSNIEFDKDVNIDFSIPSKYTKVSAKDIMKSYVK